MDHFNLNYISRIGVEVLPVIIVSSWMLTFSEGSRTWQNPHQRDS